MEELFNDVDSGDLEGGVLGPVTSRRLENLAITDDGREGGSVDELSERPRSPRKRPLDEGLDVLAQSNSIA